MAKKPVTRLQFSKNELTDEKVRKAAAKAERAADKAEAAQVKLPKKTRIQLVRQAAGEKSPGGKLRSEKKSATAAKGKLRFEKVEVPAGETNAMVRAGRKVSRAVVAGALAETKRAVDNADDGNSGTQALNSGTSAVETGGYAISNARYSHKLKQEKQAERLLHKSDEANIEALYQKEIRADPYAVSNPVSRWRQKQEIKKQYETARRTGKAAASGASNTAKGAEKAAKETKSVTEKAVEFIKEHPKGVLIVLIAAALVVFISSTFSSCSVLFQAGGHVMLGTSYTAEEEALNGVDADYSALETALANQIANIESTHSGYDEYRYNLAEIGHNPYELASYLTILFEDYTRDEVQSTLQAIFDAQYTLTLTEEVEIRTRTETRTGTSTYTDPETGETSTETYTYEVEVEYEYYILNVTLTNSGIDAVVRAAGLDEDRLSRYDVLLETRGNRDDLFGDVAFAVPGEYTDYDIPGEALTDERFRKMITEAEKYLGYPYVWGGSSPSTSFDCSGFVSYVINNCGNGWSVGRLGAVGLKDICAIIPRSEAKPGDLIFFHHTYNAPDPSNATHVGIYVGNGMMIHCGNPISYTSIESNYWQEHFLCFGRLPG